MFNHFLEKNNLKSGPGFAPSVKEDSSWDQLKPADAVKVTLFSP